MDQYPFWREGREGGGEGEGEGGGGREGAGRDRRTKGGTEGAQREGGTEGRRDGGRDYWYARIYLRLNFKNIKGFHWPQNHLITLAYNYISTFIVTVYISTCLLLLEKYPCRRIPEVVLWGQGYQYTTGCSGQYSWSIQQCISFTM